MTVLIPDQALAVSIVPNTYCAYVSEEILFTVQVQAHAAVARPVIGIVLPSVFNIKSANDVGEKEEKDKQAALTTQFSLRSDGAQEVQWTLAKPMWAGQSLTLHAQADVRHQYEPAFREYLEVNRLRIDRERALPVRAEAYARDAATRDAASHDHDHTLIAIRMMSRHVSFLPSLYRQDDNDFLGRFLMDGERRWQPLERWLDHIDILADPLLAPEPVLAWLGDWADEREDERWPAAKRRRLVRKAMWLRRWRGTRQALSEHIALYTHIKPSITEHRASPLQVGQGARLGAGVVLGSGQIPHTFSVAAAIAPDGVPLEQHTRVIRDIIEAEKPAHTHLKALTVSWASV